MKMLGAGRYKIVYKIDNPLKQGFGRHTDRETGVRPWFEPFETEWEFNYFGPGKRAGIKRFNPLTPDPLPPPEAEGEGE